MAATSERSVLITGASSGIGLATARLLAERGFRVLGTSRKPASAPRDAGIEWVAIDVCDDASVAEGVAQAVARAGPLHALVCNAGFGIFGSVEEVPLEAARAQFETNWFGTLRTLRAVIPRLRSAGSGRIVLVGSLAGRAAIPFQAHYSASKAALASLAFALHNELFDSGVRVVLVEPGDIRTAFNDATDFDLVPASSYGARIARTRAVVEKSLEAAPGPEIVARVIHRALTARRPRVRYAVGPDSRLVPIAQRLLPDRLSLRLIRSHFGL